MSLEVNSEPPAKTSLSGTGRSLSAIFDIVGGSAAGIAGVIVGQPLDVIKVRLQNPTSPAEMHGSVFSLMKTMWKNEKLLGFYKGLTPPIVGEGLLNAVFFGTYAFMQRVLQKDPDVPLTTLQGAIAGTVSGLVGAFVVSPYELVKIRIQLDKSVGADRVKPIALMRYLLFMLCTYIQVI
eukprot:TRINITY_DN4614_c0_g1_i2.p1 TRINITY_DN4614_c0_g1~~TRINITY_DN4614_c0_g1_i2.p1  ORF type:complete len:180 (-),score=18.19 TRINITY_DN4614_c0_g1_i2:35-574(-)